MSRVAVFFRALSSRWVRLWDWILRKPRLERIYRIKRTDDEPDRASPGVLYVIEDAGQAWAAVLACPGGCGQILHMNLLPDTKPVWQLTEHLDRTVSLSPSVWRREGCGCHFFLHRGRIVWV
jgi:hypothetical protein